MDIKELCEMSALQAIEEAELHHQQDIEDANTLVGLLNAAAQVSRWEVR